MFLIYVDLLVLVWRKPSHERRFCYWLTSLPPQLCFHLLRVFVCRFKYLFNIENSTTWSNVFRQSICLTQIVIDVHWNCANKYNNSLLHCSFLTWIISHEERMMQHTFRLSSRIVSNVKIVHVLSFFYRIASKDPVLICVGCTYKFTNPDNYD